MLAQLLVNGLIVGSLFSIVAVTFSLIYQTNRFLHVAHGTVITAGAYLLYTFYSLLGLNFYLSCVLTIIATGLIGYLLYKIVYFPLKKRKASSAILLITSLVLLIFMENLILLIYGGDIKRIDFIKISKGINIGSAVITPLQISIIIFSLILLIGFFVFVKYTKLGRSLRAVADNPTLAKISGINSDKICSGAFVIGSGLVGFASIFLALEFYVQPVMGTAWGLAGFIGAVIGGVSSLPGAVLGGYLLGVAENLGIWFLPSGYKVGIAFGLLFLFLLFRPQGILGIKKGIRE